MRVGARKRNGVEEEERESERMMIYNTALKKNTWPGTWKNFYTDSVLFFFLSSFLLLLLLLIPFSFFSLFLSFPLCFYSTTQKE
jgi:hypothetical protein